MLSFLLILNLPPTNSWFFVKIFRGIGDNWTKPNFTEDSKGCLVRVVFNQVEKNNPKVIFDESSLQRGWGKNIFCEWFCSSSKVLHWLQIWLRNFAALYTLLSITIHWCTHDSEMKHTLVMDREVYNANWWGFKFLKDMFVFLSLRCFSQMIFLERFSSLLIFPSPSTLILAISNIKVSF